MATVTQPNAVRVSGAGRQAQMLRNYWDQAKGPAATAFGTVVAFFVAYPPLAQGIYYLLRGGWSLLGFGVAGGEALPAFMAQSAGALVFVIGAALCLAAYRRQGSPEVLLVALGSALCLAILDVVYVFNRGVSALYVFDAAIQVGLVSAWVYGWRKGQVKAAEAVAATLVAPPVAEPVVASHP